MKRQVEYPKLLLRLQELADVLPELISPDKTYPGQMPQRIATR